MSFSMWLWRVIFPGAGVIACAFVLWSSSRLDEMPIRAIEKPPPARTAAPRRRASPRVVAEGRLAARPGAEITVGAEIGGLVVRLPAHEKAKVRKGELLVELRAEDQQAALAEAEAQLTEADVELTFQKRAYQRRTQAASDTPRLQADLDLARRDYEVAASRRRGAAAGVLRCRTALSRTRITAPIDGVVIASFIQPGETVVPGSRLVTVCDLARVRIEAEVDEFDTARIVKGADVVITAAGHGASSWRGTVEEVPDRVAERSLRPEDPGRPLDTRILLVKIALAQPTPLKLGQQVEVEIRLPR